MHRFKNNLITYLKAKTLILHDMSFLRQHSAVNFSPFYVVTKLLYKNIMAVYIKTSFQQQHGIEDHHSLGYGLNNGIFHMV